MIIVVYNFKIILRKLGFWNKKLLKAEVFGARRSKMTYYVTTRHSLDKMINKHKSVFSHKPEKHNFKRNVNDQWGRHRYLLLDHANALSYGMMMHITQATEYSNSRQTTYAKILG